MDRKEDAQLENRVWQRIRQDEEAPTLQALAVGEQNSAAVYWMLSRTVQGQQKALLRQLFERERCHGRILAGMHRAMEGKRMSIRTVPPGTLNWENTLRKCYSATLRAAREYGRRAQDGEYGGVFAYLAEEERKNCALLLELLGTDGP